MNSFNGKNQRQTKRSTFGTQTRVQTIKTQENSLCQTSSTISDISHTTVKTKSDNHPTNHQAPKEVVVDKAQNVVDKFLQKQEDIAIQYIELIEKMLGNYQDYCWAESTLLGVYDFIKENGYITKKQIETIENIKESIYD